MLRYTLRRLLGAIPTLLVIVTLAFVLLHAAPGGPFDSEKRMMPAASRPVPHRRHHPCPRQDQVHQSGQL